jgi:hypothetical protein
MQIMDRYKRYVNNRVTARKETILAAMRCALSTIRARGELPTRGRIRKELENPSWLLEKWVRVELKRIAGELGFPRNESPNRPSTAINT